MAAILAPAERAWRRPLAVQRAGVDRARSTGRRRGDLGHGREWRRSCEALARRGEARRRLRVSHAFHSPLMGPMEEEFERYAGKDRVRDAAGDGYCRR